MSFNPVVAIRLTPHVLRPAGSHDTLGRVFGLLGFRTRNPTAKEFVSAVRRWQGDNPPLDADGLLGPATWERLLPAVAAYAGRVPAGNRPEWIGPPARAGRKPIAEPPPVGTYVGTVATTPEDRAIRELSDAWWRMPGRPGSDPFLAVPFDTAEAAGGRGGLPSLATRGVCGTLRPGQVWRGLSGADRIIVALASGGRRGTGTVTFLTDGGQTYRQPTAGWAADVLAAVYAGVSRSPTPMQSLTDVEVEALVGATAALGGAAFPPVVSSGAVPWVIRNRDDITMTAAAVGAAVGAVERLRAIAPAAADLITRSAFGRLLADLSEEPRGPRRVARAVGSLLVMAGMAGVKRDAAAVVESLAALVNRAAVLIALTTPATEILSGESRAADRVRTRRKTGVVPSSDDAERALADIGRNLDQVTDLIHSLQRILRPLT